MRHRLSDKCAPMPKQASKYPRPTRILSRSNLENAWRSSRDSTRRCGAPGTDRVRAKTYGIKIDLKLADLAARIRSDQFRFSTLRPVPIPKPGQSKDRVICVPTVEDRLVQRAIARYLHKRKLFPIYNEASFGFIPEIGTQKALKELTVLRRQYDFVFETDISAFFDNIERERLIEKVKSTLGKHSLVPLLKHVITREIKTTAQCSQAKLESLGIFRGKGLRQGMPLSPMLANLALAEFDAAVLSRDIKMIRYADDIVVLASSRNAALEAGEFVREKLCEYRLSIPDFGEEGKTKLASKSEPVQFLGREVVFSEKVGKFVQRVPKSKIEKMKTAILELADLDTIISAQSTFPEVANKITQKAVSYIASYSDAHNHVHLKNEMNHARANALRAIYTKIFGDEAVRNLSSKHIQFLGLNAPPMDLDDIEYTY